MNSKQKEILQAQRNFLVKNIIWTDELSKRLVTQGLLADSVLKEIQAAKGRDEKVSKLLDVLPLKGGNSYEKFCDTLQICGHFFLADFLRDEESGREVADIRDLYKKMAFLEKLLKESDKRKLEEFVIEKAKEEYLKNSWSKPTKDMEKALDAKQKQLEQGFEFEEQMKQKNAEISRLSKTIEECKNENITLNSQIRSMNQTLQEAENKYKENYNVQVKFSMASEHSLQRVSERLKMAEDALKTLDARVNKLLEEDVHVAFIQNDMADNPFSYINKGLQKLTQEYVNLLNIRKQYDILLEERNYILSHLGFKPNDSESPSLLKAYKEFAVKSHENISALREQVASYNNTIEGQEERIRHLNKENEGKRKFAAAGNVWQGAIMSVMRKQLQDVKHDNRVKDTKIEHFEQTIAKLRLRVAELEKLEQEMRTIDSKGVGPLREDKGGKDSIKPPDHAVNGRVSVQSSNEEEGSVIRSEVSRKRNTLLPPLNKPPDGKGQGSPTPRRSNQPKLIVPVQRSTGDYGGLHVPVPDTGLITSQLKLENRALPKHGHQLGHGLGDLKAMHAHGKFKMANGQLTVGKSTNVNS